MLIVSAVLPHSFLSNTRSTLQNRVILTSTFTPSFSWLNEAKCPDPKLPQSFWWLARHLWRELPCVARVVASRETVTNSESSDTEAYSHFNNVWQPINMAFCTETFLIGFYFGSFYLEHLLFSNMAGPAVLLCVGHYSLNSALTRVYSTL